MKIGESASGSTRENAESLTPHPSKKWKGFGFWFYLFALDPESRKRQWTFVSGSRKKGSENVYVCDTVWCVFIVVCFWYVSVWCFINFNLV